MGANGSTQLQDQSSESGFGSRLNDDDYNEYRTLGPNEIGDFSFQFDNVYDFGYSAIWSVSCIDSKAPAQRTGHATAYDPKTDKAFIAFGISSDKKQLNDIWEIDMKTKKWSKIEVNKSIAARAGTRMVIVGTKLWLFGGFSNNHYFGKLFTVDINTGVVEYPETTGEGPTACSGHSMNYSNGKIFIFGGFADNAISQFKILDLQTMHWKSVNTKESKISHASCVFNNLIYLFGGSRSNGMMCIDPVEDKIRHIKTTGPAPQNTSTRGCLAPIGEKFLAYFDGSSGDEKGYTIVKVFDIDRRKWSILPILPDGYTTLLTDGEISNEGIFKIPSISDVSCLYRPGNREINIFQGKPFKDPPMCCELYTGEVAASLNQQADMCQMLSCMLKK